MTRHVRPAVKALLPAAAVAVTAACSATSAAAGAPSARELESLRALRGQLHGPTATSSIFGDEGTTDVAVALLKQVAAPALPQVGIYAWASDRWRSVARVTLDVGGTVSADGGGAATPIRTVDLTPAAPPDLLVTVHYNAGPATAVISKFGGRWHALTFHGGVAGDGDERFDVRAGSQGVLTSAEDDCVPDCANGHQVTTSYRFSPTTGRLDAYTKR